MYFYLFLLFMYPMPLSTPQPTSIRYDYTGAVQTYSPSAGTTSITVTLVGASGGTHCGGYGPSYSLYGCGIGGHGAIVTATIQLSVGTTIYIYVGGAGANKTAISGNGLNGGEGLGTVSGGYNVRILPPNGLL